MSLVIECSGLGIIMYSESAVAMISEGEDYLAKYESDGDVQRHIQAGTIVGFGTGSPGTYVVDVLVSSPPNRRVTDANFKLRLGIVVDQMATLYVRDLYDLISWKKTCDTSVSVPAGVYRITVVSDIPVSGVIGDMQVITMYFEDWGRMPELAKIGIPMLC